MSRVVQEAASHSSQKWLQILANRHSERINRYMAEALELRGSDRFSQRCGFVSGAPIHVLSASPPKSPGLQAADCFLWALQRLYERREERYVALLWSRFSLVHDLDDTRQARYGVYYTQKKPLTSAARGDLPGI